MNSCPAQDKEETLLAHQSAEINYRQRRNLLRAVMEEKVLRVARGTAMGGAKLGVFTGLFCAAEQYLAFRRSTHDTLNVVAAGGLTAATIGFLCTSLLLLALKVDCMLVCTYLSSAIFTFLLILHVQIIFVMNLVLLILHAIWFVIINVVFDYLVLLLLN